MQNWKIKKMSNNELKANIGACNKFLRVYKNGDYLKGSSCLFCDIVKKFHPKCDDRCSYCLWEILEGKECDDFSERKFENLVEDVKHTKKWRTTRLEQLPRWKKILQAEKDNRADVGA